MLDDRKALILRVLVEEYIRTGEPVSSRAVLDSSRLTCSSATVRNELSALERDGWVAKPHTSAGRVPTNAGYRYYVDHLSPASLRTSVRSRIEGFFAIVHTELRELLKDTSELLADITHYPAVVVGPGLRGQTVRDVHLLPIEPGVVLLVIVTSDGQVRQTVLRCDEPATPGEVTVAQQMLSDLIAGEVLDEEISVIDLPDSSADLPAQSADLIDRALAAVESVARGHRDVYLGGTSRMASLWEDLAQIHRILAIVEQEATVLQLVSDDVSGTSVRLGSELPSKEADLAVVSRSFGTIGTPGHMGVFGPMRMDYRRTISVVEEVSEGLDEQFGP